MSHRTNPIPLEELVERYAKELRLYHHYESAELLEKLGQTVKLQSEANQLGTSAMKLARGKIKDLQDRETFLGGLLNRAHELMEVNDIGPTLRQNILDAMGWPGKKGGGT